MSDIKIKSQKENQQRVDIPVTLDRAELMKQFNNERTRPAMEKHMDELIAMVQPVVRPKGLYRVACVGARDSDWVEIDGVSNCLHFTSTATFCQTVFDLIIALRIVSNFRIQATRATFLALPASNRCW